MQRRTLLSGLGFGVLAMGATAPSVPAKTRPAEITSYLTHVDEAALAFDHSGRPVLLRRSERVGYDPNGLEVVTEDRRTLGRLPPIHSAFIAPLVDSGLISGVYLVSQGPRPVIRMVLS